jgi:hypothetical protein
MFSELHRVPQREYRRNTERRIKIINGMRGMKNMKDLKGHLRHSILWTRNKK